MKTNNAEKLNDSTHFACLYSKKTTQKVPKASDQTQNFIHSSSPLFSGGLALLGDLYEDFVGPLAGGRPAAAGRGGHLGAMPQGAKNANYNMFAAGSCLDANIVLHPTCLPKVVGRSIIFFGSSTGYYSSQLRFFKG